QSGFDERQGYVYARIARPGLYTAIGIPNDPRVRTTLQLMDVMRGWDNANGDMGFLPKICGLILCDPELQERVEQFREEGGGLLGDLGFDPGDFDGGLGDVQGGTLCDVCLCGG